MTQATIASPIPPVPKVERAWEDVHISFELLTDSRLVTLERMATA